MVADQFEFLMGSTQTSFMKLLLGHISSTPVLSHILSPTFPRQNFELLQLMLPQNPSFVAQPLFTACTIHSMSSPLSLAIRSTHIKTIIFQSIHYHFIFCSANSQNAFKRNTYLNKRKSL